jgi:uncharacterized protein (TIGR00297 family)
MVAALGVGAAMCWAFGWRGAALLLAFFISGSVLTQLATGRGGRRNARQVIANGGAAALGALFGSWPAAAGALAAAAADTWATELGSFSPVPPRFITTGARVTRGMSGGITALGTVGGIAGALSMAALAHLLPPSGAAAGLAVVAAAGIAGMLADSLLGATGQGVYECAACAARSERADTICHQPVQLIRGWRWLDNDAVNLVATLVGAGLGVLGARIAS